MNNKSPAFQWYPKDNLSSQRVALMTLAEEGAYRRALDFCWLHGSVPADEKKLAKLIAKGCTAKMAETVKAMFLPKPGDENQLIHERLEAERQKQEEHRQKQKDNGRRGGRPPKTENHDKANQNPRLNSNQTQTKAKESSALPGLQSPVSEFQFSSSNNNDGDDESEKNLHKNFLEDFFKPENEYDREAICTQANILKIEKYWLERFNSHLITERKIHADYREWMKHFRYWLIKKLPELKNINNDYRNERELDNGKIKVDIEL